MHTMHTRHSLDTIHCERVQAFVTDRLCRIFLKFEQVKASTSKYVFSLNVDQGIPKAIPSTNEYHIQHYTTRFYMAGCMGCMIRYD